VMGADRWGKLKTIFQMIFVIAALLVLCLPAATSPAILTQGLSWILAPSMWIAVFLTALSGWNYLRASFVFLVESK
jgi:phosphatidylglycerophosphate synthase